MGRILRCNTLLSYISARKTFLRFWRQVAKLNFQIDISSRFQENVYEKLCKLVFFSEMSCSIPCSKLFEFLEILVSKGCWARLLIRSCTLKAETFACSKKLSCFVILRTILVEKTFTIFKILFVFAGKRSKNTKKC